MKVMLMSAWKRSAWRRGATAFVILLLTACASTPEADPLRDAEAKRFEAVTRDSVIYVYRPDGGTGTAECEPSTINPRDRGFA
jgi:hypothetical protein